MAIYNPLDPNNLVLGSAMSNDGQITVCLVYDRTLDRLYIVDDNGNKKRIMLLEEYVDGVYGWPVYPY